MTNHRQAAIEAAARAIAKAKCDPLLHSEIQRGLYADKRWHEYEADATAAIEAYLAAMREAGFVMVPVEPNDLDRYRSQLNAVAAANPPSV